MGERVESGLGDYLRDRRMRLAPQAFGLGSARRRTPGLRREEVAQRANISPTWYTWLEQGRGGAPSAEVLDRLAGALLLTDVEREHLFLLGLGRPPERRFRPSAVTPRLQRVLDALLPCPALIRTAVWDVVAWNRAAALVLTDYGALAPAERNLLRFMFLDERARAAQHDWESVARFVLAAFRAEASRAGAQAEMAALVAELSARSAAFRAMWRENDVMGTPGEGVKHVKHPVLGELGFEFSTFGVDGRTDLSMIVYHPARAADWEKVAGLLAAQAGATGAGAGALRVGEGDPDMADRHDPGDAVPPGVAPQTPAPLTEEDRTVREKLERFGEHDSAERDPAGNAQRDREVAAMTRTVQPGSDAPSRAGISGVGTGADSERG